MSANTPSGPSDYQRGSVAGILAGTPDDRGPDRVAQQLDLATEAALAAIPAVRPTTRLSAGRALEASIERYLSEGGLADIARRYRAYRRRRAVSSAPA